MSKRFTLATSAAAFAALFFIAAVSSPAQTAYDSVDPIIGTTGGGNTYPGASLPFGMIQWSPDTQGDGWYFYEKDKIRGFSLTHISGAGCPVFGDFPILPWTGELAGSPGTNPEAYAVSFSHSKEEAHPGYYAV